MEIRQALTFDDVMLVPAASSILPGDTDTRTRIPREIELGIPLISAAMDTVTEGALAIAMAQAGGLGGIPRKMPIEQQGGGVRKVKKFEAGMVVNPVTIHPDETLADALRLMAEHRISGIPVVERGPYPNQPGRLCGILTNRDVRFADDPREPVAELMTREGLITVRESVGKDEAKRPLHQHRIEKLLVVDGEYRCIGLITVKDIEKAQLYPHACKDEQGRLRVAAAAGTGRAELERAEALFAAGVDIMVVDTAHGHSTRVIDTVSEIRRMSNYTQVIVGNVATAEGARAVIEAGAGAVTASVAPRPVFPNSPRSPMSSASAASAAARTSPMAASSSPAISPRRSPPAPIARCSARCSPAPMRARARFSCSRAAATNTTAAWARSARWRAARPTAISSRK